MKYEVINKELGLAHCALVDLTMEQVTRILGQWEPGANIGSLILFYDKESDLIVFNSSNKSYKFWVDIVEAYLVADGEDAEVFKEKLDKYSNDIRTVLDNCVKTRTIGKEVEIIKVQKLGNEYVPILQSLWKEPDTSAVMLAINAFNYGMMCGKRAERARRKQRA